MDVILVNNTGADVRQFDNVFAECVRDNKPLPHELADVFNLEIITADGRPRGILTWA